MIKDRKREKSNNLVDRAKSANRFIFIRRGEDTGKGGLRLMSSLTEKQMKGKDTNISASCFPPSHPSMEMDENWHQWSAEWQQVSLMLPFFIFRSQNNRDSRERRAREGQKDRQRGGEHYSMASWFSWSALVSSLVSLPSLLLLLFLCLCLRWLSPSSLSCLLLLLLLKGIRKMKLERAHEVMVGEFLEKVKG